jgi:single-stranded DNA-binding protein
MSGGGYLDAAIQGMALTAPQLKTSANGKPWARFLLVVGDGEDKQFCWVVCFGEDAGRAAQSIARGAKVYAEGALTSAIYEREGKPTVSLSIAARRLDILNQIGKNRPQR